jgi:natural product precursor
MKKLKKLKLNVLSEANLRDKEMNGLKGGGNQCGCSCAYANNGGSCTGDNLVANSKGGYTSKNSGDGTWYSDRNAHGNCDSWTAYHVSYYPN